MPKKKAPNWGEIRLRFTRWEKPIDIAKDYNTTANAISKRACLEGWRKEREEIARNVSGIVENDLKTLCDTTLAVHIEFMQNLQGQVKDITNPYLFDGERTNSLFQTAMNNSVKVMLAAMKAYDDAKEQEEPASPEELGSEDFMENIKRIINK